MKIYKLFLLAACAAFGFFACQQPAQASVRNQRTILHVHNPIQIPGVVLSPGVYTVHLVNPNTSRNIVQFTNRSDNQVVATLIAVNNKRMQPSGKTELSFYEPRPGNPPALRSWFYPGMEYGVEFVYSESQASGIAKEGHRYVPTMADADMNSIEHQASNGSVPQSMSSARIYETAPNGGQVSASQGDRNNAKMDRNPSWKQHQETYHTYADVENGNGK